ncbi:MAG: SET domain-containing protein-lysine N-methyltransferase [Candidatus Electrothrix aestuarii]|uniref:SET domain-containing protein-lysine N-methyltransferase n=1 Tax=Candidatus Electrothrix aestuarii TaxID=3062594 RepID=A0AAU8LTG8_9BACT|nr:SET domain-containing protein-lysine N-methyltransferase [Candidatus Electrothrix aestuarii]
MIYPKKFGINPLYPQAADFEVIYKDTLSGSGVITKRYFAQGDLLAMVAGEEMSEILQHTLQIAPDRHMYDPYFTGYFLHSCSPNVSLDMSKRTVTALCDIEAGSFLSMDYAETEDVLFKQFPCSCGSPNCRLWITGRKETATAPYVAALTSSAGLMATAQMTGEY